ncbi:MAG: hypothetical protein ACR2FY_11305 [Pirellulaceae bacterium]
MTKSSLINAEPLIAPPVGSARRRLRMLIGMMSVYLFLAFAAPILTDEAGLLLLRSGWWRDVDQYWLYGCVILVAGWTALGPGRLAIRMPQGLIAVGWLLLAWLLGLTISPNWKYEVQLTTLAGISVAVTTFAILLMVRLSSGRRLVQTDGTSGEGPKRFQYSLATLLFVMLLICVTFALLGWIDSKYRKDATLWPYWYSAAWRKALTWDVWKEAIDPLLIAVVCLPAFLSNRPRAFAWILGLFVAALVALLVKNEALRDYISYSLDERNAVYEHYINRHLFPGMVNLATVSACLLSAAAAMRWLGYRIQAPDPNPGSVASGEGIHA